MLRFIGVKELYVVCFLSPFLTGPGKLTEQYILLVDSVQLGIVIGYYVGEEDGNDPSTEHDTPEPSTDVWRGKERPQVIVWQTKEQVTRHVFPDCQTNWRDEDSGVGTSPPNHRRYGCFHNNLVDDCHSWSGRLFLDFHQYIAVVFYQGLELFYNRFLTVPGYLDLMGFSYGSLIRSRL